MNGWSTWEEGLGYFVARNDPFVYVGEMGVAFTWEMINDFF